MVEREKGRKLRTIPLDRCGGAKALASALVGNDTLSEMDLSTNRISRKGSESLGKMVAVNSGLLYLNLRSNGLDTTVGKQWNNLDISV